MEQELLDKLKIKPIPKSVKPIGIKIKTDKPYTYKKEKIDNDELGEIDDKDDKEDLTGDRKRNYDDKEDLTGDRKADRRLGQRKVENDTNYDEKELSKGNSLRIIDKTSKKLINREDFLKRLNLDTQKSRISYKAKTGDDTDFERGDRDNIMTAKIKKDVVTMERTLILNIRLLEGLKFIITRDALHKSIKVDTKSKTRILDKKDRITKRPEERPLTGDVSLLGLKDRDREILFNRLPPKQPDILIKSSTYYMNNRDIFVNFINSLFEPYKKELIDLDNAENKQSCDTATTTTDFTALTHQKIVKDYINLYTPYRGLLLYHGLGSGKTCSSIGIAEGIKTDREIIVMTPASLRANYIEELKKCGDAIYKKTQYWVFMNTSSNPALAAELSNILNISVEFINRNGGAWFVDVKQKANYDTLSNSEQVSLNQQIDEMIKAKYRFINYNGIRMQHLAVMTRDFQINPFDNKVVIVDEAHNLISRIINKLKRPTTLPMRLYDYLMSAENCKIVLLSGTPIINYPNEIGIMFNILRGYINTFSFRLKISDKRKIDTNVLQKMFNAANPNPNPSGSNNASEFIDYLEYKPTSNMLVITRNPFGFYSQYKATGLVSGEKKYEGVKKGKATKGTKGDSDKGDRDKGDQEIVLTNDEFVDMIVDTLKDNNIEVDETSMKMTPYKTLPDDYDKFKTYFIDDHNNVKNHNLLKHRIIGLTSYFPDIVQLLPKYQKSKDFEVVKIEMSEFQFGVYEEARVKERQLEKQNKKNKKKGANEGDDIYREAVSTYRIFSRAFCNFVFPRPTIRRPMPNVNDDVETVTEGTEREGKEPEGKSIQNTIINEANMDILKDLEDIGDVEAVYDADEIEQAEAHKDKDDKYDKDEKDDKDEKFAEDLDEVKITTPIKSRNVENAKMVYERKIREVLKELSDRRADFLTPEALQIYSPKFLNILENLQDPTYRGLHLIYSQFRTLEGIGILKLVLQANGFAEFKIRKSVSGEWELNIAEEDMVKPKFALYTGTESVEEREIVRNIFNNNVEILPTSIIASMKTAGLTPGQNFEGEIIKLLMITASGAEGINLKNVRYVHIVESFWHPVRMEQVIGRARRICSHKDLPPELQTVKVFLYLMTFSKEQLDSDASIELRLNDKSKRDGKTPLTSDEALYEIATIKETINKNLLTTIKESAIDCSIHVRNKNGDDENSGLQCFSIGNPKPEGFTYLPNIEQEETDRVAQINREKITWKAVKVSIEGIEYAFRKDTGEVYDLDSYRRKNPVLIGHLEMKGKEYKFKKI